MPSLLCGRDEMQWNSLLLQLTGPSRPMAPSGVLALLADVLGRAGPRIEGAPRKHRGQDCKTLVPGCGKRAHLQYTEAFSDFKVSARVLGPGRTPEEPQPFPLPLDWPFSAQEETRIFSSSASFRTGSSGASLCVQGSSVPSCTRFARPA